MRALFTLFASFVFAISFSWAQQTKTATINFNNYNSYDDFYENGPPWYGIHTGFVNCNDTNERDNRYCSLLGEPDYNFSKEEGRVNIMGGSAEEGARTVKIAIEAIAFSPYSYLPPVFCTNQTSTSADSELVCHEGIPRTGETVNYNSKMYHVFEGTFVGEVRDRIGDNVNISQIDFTESYYGVLISIKSVTITYTTEDSGGDDDNIDLALNMKFGQVFQIEPDNENPPRLVQNKSADVLIYPEVASYSSTDYLVQNDFKEVEIKVNQGERELGTVVKTLSEMRSLGENDPIIFDGVDTSEVGITELTANIRFLDSEIVDPDSNNEQTAQADVTWTNPLKLGIFDIKGCKDENGASLDHYGPIDSSFISGYLQGEPKQLIEETFPVADSGVSLDYKKSITGSCDKGFYQGKEHTRGMLADLKMVSRLKQGGDFSFNRAVAIASSGYFKYHITAKKERLSGVAFTPDAQVNYPGSIVEESYNPAFLSHELLHTFVGDLQDKTLDEDKPHTLRDIEKGYSSLKNKTYIKSNLVENYMVPIIPPVGFTHWLDMQSYNLLFNAATKKIEDPPVIIVSGDLGDDGSLTLDKTVVSDTGVVTESPSTGDFEILLKDTEDNIVHSFQYDPKFELLVHPGGIEYTGVEPFVVSLPYSPDTSEVEVRYLGEIKAQFDPISSSLVDAMKSLTFEQIKGRSSRLRKIRKTLLVKQAKFIENLNNKYNEAKSKCENSNSSRRWRGGFLNFFKNDCVKEKSLKTLLKLKLSLYKKAIKLRVNSKDGVEVNRNKIVNILNKMKGRI